MPTIKIGRRAIAAIETPTKPAIFFDDSLTGFGLAVRPSGARSWVVEFRPGPGGRSVAKRRLTLGDPASMSPEAARAAAKAILARVALGEDPAGERAELRQAASVEQLADRWLREHVAPKRKPATLANYDHILRTHILSAIGSRRAASLTRADVARLHNDIAAPRRAPAKPRAKRSPTLKAKGGRIIANRSVEVLSALLHWAANLGALPDTFKNPCRGIEPFREEGRERFLGVAEMAQLGETLRLAETVGLPWPEGDEAMPNRKHLARPENRRTTYSAHVTAAIRLLMLTGCRLREVLNLRWQDVDFERGFLNLPDSKTGRRVIVLSAPAIAILTELPRLGRFVIASDTAGTTDEKPRADINRPWRAIRSAAGLEALRIHDLRHSFASVGVGAGLGLPEVGKLLGHTQASTTKKYAHFAHTGERRAADIIGVEIARALGLGSADVIDLEARRHA